jgi:high-affinity Fe2+/Pb2+ permease
MNILTFLKLCICAILAFFVIFHLFDIATAQNMRLLRYGLLFVVGLFFAIRWQKRNKRKDDAE